MKRLKKTLAFILMSTLIITTFGCSKSNTEVENQQSNTNTKEKKDNSSKNPMIISEDENFKAPTLIASPTNSSAIVNILPNKDLDLYVEYGTKTGTYSEKSDVAKGKAEVPCEIEIENLKGNTKYYYRVMYGENGSFNAEEENSFYTQRSEGSTFTFGIQGDSHPERPQQFDSSLYLNTMENITADNPDFYLTIGDDFSVDKLVESNKEKVEELYLNQRQYLGRVGGSAPLFLVNGNHEQAAKYVLDGTENNVAVWGQNARNSYFSQPTPNDFYTGDSQKVDNIGYLRDYYSWNWGDALFVVIDPYWHSDEAVDNKVGTREKNTDGWATTLGDDQYQWFKNTLEKSTAKYKFVFTHHVLGTGRGGTELANLYEWGGNNKNGKSEFESERPNWEKPIHQLMVDNDVTIFFQGHDHVFVKQELDGVIYQSLPQPADPNYTLYNDTAYKSDAIYPNTGHVRVTVSPEEVKVDYIKSVLPENESDEMKNREIIYSYTTK